MIKTTDIHTLEPAKRPVGRPRKQRTQTPDERRAYMRAYQATPERRERARQYQARRRAQETSEEREDRLAYDRLRHRLRRESERPEEREERLAKQRARYREQRSRETPEEREARLTYEREIRALRKRAVKSTSRGLTSDPREASKGSGR